MQDDIDKHVKQFVRVPTSLFGVYLTIVVQFVGVCFMSGVVWTKLDYQSKAIDELKAALAVNLDDRWRKTDHDYYADKASMLIRDFERRVSELEKNEGRRGDGKR